MKKLFTLIALICLLGFNVEAKSTSTSKKSTSTSKPNKKKAKSKLFYGSCGYGLIYDSSGNIWGFWSCWEGVDGTKTTTITPAREE